MTNVRSWTYDENWSFTVLEQIESVATAQNRTSSLSSMDFSTSNQIFSIRHVHYQSKDSWWTSFWRRQHSDEDKEVAQTSVRDDSAWSDTSDLITTKRKYFKTVNDRMIHTCIFFSFSIWGKLTDERTRFQWYRVVVLTLQTCTCIIQSSVTIVSLTLWADSVTRLHTRPATHS